MKCEDIRRHFSAYVDHETPSEITEAIEAHAAECEDCRSELAAYQSFCIALSSVGEEELPFDFDVTLRANLDEADQAHPMKKTKIRGWVKALTACACLLLAVCVVGLGATLLGRAGATAPDAAMPMASSGGSAKSANFAYDDTWATEAEMPMDEEAYLDGEVYFDEDAGGPYYSEDRAVADVPMQTAEAMPAEKSSTVQRKIIKDYNLSIEVEDFDASYERICHLAEELGGYVASGNSYDYEGSTRRDGWLTIRVDAARADEAVKRIGELGKIEENSFSSSDVTSEYYDIQTRLEQYEAQEKRLLELYERADTIEDLISLESELARVTTEIESMKGMLRYYDQLTALSSISINLYTPNTYTRTVEPTGWAGFAENLKSGFLQGINGLLDVLAGVFIFLVTAFPFLLVIGLIVLVIVLLARRRRKKRAAKKN